MLSAWLATRKNPSTSTMTATQHNNAFASDEEYLDYVLIMIIRIFAWSLLAIFATTTSVFLGMCIKHGIGSWRASRRAAAVDLEAGDIDVGHALAYQLYRDCPPAYEEGATGMQKPPAYHEVAGHEEVEDDVADSDDADEQQD